jgi:hypothetical protein
MTGVSFFKFSLFRARPSCEIPGATSWGVRLADIGYPDAEPDVIIRKDFISAFYFDVRQFLTTM